MEKPIIITTLFAISITLCSLLLYSHAQSNMNPILSSPTNLKQAIRSAIPLIEVEFQSDSLVVLRGDEEILLVTNGTMAPFWNAIDIVKHHDYSLDDIATAGMGSKGNPTRFYAIMSKP